MQLERYKTTEGWAIIRISQFSTNLDCNLRFSQPDAVKSFRTSLMLLV